MKLKRILLSAFLLVVFLLLICQALTPTLPMPKDIIPDNSAPLVNAQAASAQTLAVSIQNYLNAITAAGYWNTNNAASVYPNNAIAAYQMGEWSFSQLQNYSQYIWNTSTSAYNDADNVFEFFTETNRFGLLNQTEIDWALDHFVMLPNGLPESEYTSNALGVACFGITQRYELEGFYFANLYSHNTSAWNVVNAYASFRTAINSYHDGAPATYYVNANNQTWCYWGNGQPRWYDEAMETVDCFVKFYLIGTDFPRLINPTDALNEAVLTWNWYNNNGWGDSDPTGNGLYHYYYHPSDSEWECESGGFLEIALELEHYDPGIGNLSRIVTDMYNRYLEALWSSPQWASGGGAIVHANPGNSEVRGVNTLMALSSLLGAYPVLNSSAQTDIQELLGGYSGYNPAWELLYTNPSLNLYSPSSGLFQLVGDGRFSTGQTESAVDYAPTMLLMEGMVPQTACLAIPIEDNYYESNQAMCDGQLFSINVTSCILTVSVLTPGTLTFIYGSSPVNDTFPLQGTYQVQFDPTWNTITSTTFENGLPSNRLYMGQVLSGRGTLQVTNSPSSVVMDVGQPQLFTSSVSGGNSPYMYQWFLNGSEVQGATGSTWTFTPTSSGLYNVYVNVTDSTGLIVESDIAFVTVNPTFSVSVSPTLVSVEVGQFQLFTSNVSGGTGPYSYQWYAEGVLVSGATSATWAFTPTSAGSYAVFLQVTDIVGMVAISNSASVSATVPPIISILNPGPGSYLSGWNASSTVRYAGTPDFVFYSNETSSDSTFFVNVTVTNVTNLDGWCIGLVYANSTLQFVNAWLPTDNVFAPLAAIGVPLIQPSVVVAPINATYQEIEWSASYAQPSPTWDFNGTGTLAQLEFEIVAEVNITNTQASSSFTFDPAWTSVYYWPSGSEVPTLNAANFVYESPEHDVGVTNVVSSKTAVGQGYCLNVTVIAADPGAYTETFNVTVYANTTIIASQNVTLSSGNSANVTFSWNTTGFAYGNYTLWAYAPPVPGETNTANNNCTGGWVIVAGVGDITGSPSGLPDGACDMTDVALVASLFGINYPNPKYNPNADVNGDGVIDISDVAIVARYFGSVYPYPPYP